MNNAMRAMTLAAAVAVSGAAIAADLPGGPRPYYAPAHSYGGYNWTGFYAGGNIGYTWGSISNSGASPYGVLGGAQAGYNWQSGAFVFGGETDIQASDAHDTFAPYKFSNPWFGTLRGRAGYAFNNILFYGTAGLAYGDLSVDSAGLTESKDHLGWTGGVGMEVGFSPRLSAKVEYLYMDLSSSNYTLTGASNGFASNMVRLGINYHF
jgi:outer membrane immunogenic protein